MEKSPKKWSLGNILFRKSKKEIPQADFSSDEDDRKAGFGNEFTKKSPSKHKTNKQLVQSFDQQQYSVANPEFHYFKPSQPPQQQQQQQQYFYNNGTSQQFLRPQIYQNNLEYINNQINLEKNRVVQPQYIYNNNTTYLQYQGSSQDEKSSYNSLSSPINKSGSETGSRTSLNKKTRSARNERYYQRILRDDGRAVTVYGSVNSVENNNNGNQMPLNGSHNRLSASLNSSSICSSDFMVNPLTQSHSLPIAATQRFRGNADDRDDYENIHEMDESVPPPIPPRDPNRRFSINSSISQNPYYFDHALQKYVVFNASGKCFSDDKLCKANVGERPKSARTDKIVDTKNTTKQHDILRPRSRKPLNVHTNLDNECVFSSEDVVDNPRQYPISQRSKSAIDFEKMMNSDPLKSKYAQRQRNLTSVEPIKYQVLLQQQQIQREQQERIDELQALRKKYSSAEDVNRNKVNMRSKLPTANILPGTRKSLNEMDLKVKEGNVSSSLDDAINELELMYKSLVKDEDLMERAARRDLPTPTKFSQLMRKYEEYENEENRVDKEPDIVLDDVFSRNLKYANQRHKITESQPPFGIPNQRLCPIPPKPAQDYLSVEPVHARKLAQNNPDLVTDDLAVRNLRKDNPNYSRRRNMIEIDNNHFMKRNHTLSSLSDSIYNGILKDSAKPSGGNLLDYLNFEASPAVAVAKTNSDNKSKDVKSSTNNKKSSSQKKCVTAERANFEESLNALVIESKAISQKLEKDLSNLKRESVTPKSTTASSPSQPPKTLVNLLDFRKSMEREKKSTSSSPIKNVGEDQQKPNTTSTGCSPITDFDIREEIIRDQAPKQHKTEKIGNLIKMFNTTMSPEPVRKGLPAKVPIEKPSRKLSDVSKMFEKATEVDTKPPTQPASTHVSHVAVKKVNSDEKVTPKIIQPRTVSPTVMHAPNKFTSATKVILATPPPSPKATTKVMNPTLSTENKPDVESNINNIKELIQQIKLTEFEKNKRDAMKPDILKSAQSDSLLPDYDNIKDDYEMTDGGRLERTTTTAKIVAVITKPDFLPAQEPLLKVSTPKDSNSEFEENSPDVKSITTTSSSLRETSVESSSKDSFSQCSEHANDNSAAIYKDAIEFLQETADPKSMALSEDDHKSPIKSIRQDKEVVLNYIDKMNENLEAVKNNTEEIPQPKYSVKESVSKLEQKISLSRQNSEAISDDSTPPVKQPSPPVQIRPVVLPKVGPSDTESLYNSSEELAEIFGHAEQQRDQNVTMHPGKIIEEDFEAEFEKIALDDEIIDDKILDENFNVTLIDINNNSDFADCFDNELSDLTNESAMSSASAKSSADIAGCSKSDNNNNLTNDFSKLTTNTDCFLMNRKASTSNTSNKHHSSNSLKTSSSASSKSDNSSSTLQQQPLKTQCILLACLYCVMLYMQFIIYNFKSNN